MYSRTVYRAYEKNDSAVMGKKCVEVNLHRHGQMCLYPDSNV